MTVRVNEEIVRAIYSTAEGTNKQSAPSASVSVTLVSGHFPQAFAAAASLFRSCCMSCRMAAILPGERCSDQAS